jgi:MFS family permease
VSSKPNVSIHGDGNAVGDHNRILVDKRTYNKIVSPGNGGGPPNDSRNGMSGEVLFVVVIAALVALAAAAWQFALYAPLVYLVLVTGSVVVLMALLGSVLAALYESVPWSWITARCVAVFATVLLAASVVWSSAAYPQELSTIAAQATSWRGFFCGLSSFGQSVATLHMLAMSLLAAPALVVMAGYALGSVGAALFFLRGWIWCGRVALALGSRAWPVIAMVLVVCAALSQTMVASAVWQQLYQDRLYTLFALEPAGQPGLCK